MSNETAKATFITFYSFKGGVGRSMALINTAGILAGRGFRVLVIDLDLEAPGLSYLNPSGPNAPSSQDDLSGLAIQPGFIDLLGDAKNRGKEADLFVLSVEELVKRYTRPYTFPENYREYKDGKLYLMPAGQFDSDYSKRFDDLNLHALYQQGIGEPLIRTFKNKLASADIFDYVLVDSRTGFSDVAGVCTRDLADYLVILSGLNRQNISGTCAFLKALRSVTKGQEKKFQIVLSPVPNGEDSLVDNREEEAKASFTKAWGAEIDIHIQIPYHPQLALTEEPHIFRRRRGYLFEAYRDIERSILKSLGHDAEQIARRITELIGKGEFTLAISNLRHLIKLDDGKAALPHLVLNLTHRSPAPARSDIGLRQEGLTFNELLSDNMGRRLIEFIIDNYPLDQDNYIVEELFRRLKKQKNAADLAERLLDRRISEVPKSIDVANEFINFNVERGKSSKVDSFLKQAIESKPNDSFVSMVYAKFLEDRGDRVEADSYWRKALSLEVKDPEALRFFAVFLSEKNKPELAAEYYKRVLNANPNDAMSLGNYGQILIELGDFEAAKAALLRALEHLSPNNLGDRAEVCLSLWLAAVMTGQNALPWEQSFKFLIDRSFKRHRWSFDRILAKANLLLKPDEFNYAKALISAFLDKKKVARLSSYERWRMLKPVELSLPSKDTS